MCPWAFDHCLLHLAGQNGDGRVDPVGHAVYDRVPMRDLHGAGSENYTRPRPKTVPGKNCLRTSYNIKARTGHKYWYQDRPKPTSCELKRQVTFSITIEE